MAKQCLGYNLNFVYHQNTEYENGQYKFRCRFATQVFYLACTHKGYLTTSDHNFETHKEVRMINFSTTGERI